MTTKMRPNWQQVCELATEDISRETVLKMAYGPELAKAQRLRLEGLMFAQHGGMIEFETIQELMRVNGLDYGIANALATMARG